MQPRSFRTAKERRYVTYENLNAVFSSEKITSEQIEDILVMLNEMGINVVESGETEAEAEEARAEEHRQEPEEEKPDGELVEVARTTPAKTEKSELAERTDDPVRMYLREIGLGRAALAPGRDRRCQAGTLSTGRGGAHGKKGRGLPSQGCESSA